MRLNQSMKWYKQLALILSLYLFNIDTAFSIGIEQKGYDGHREDYNFSEQVFDENTDKEIFVTFDDSDGYDNLEFLDKNGALIHSYYDYSTKNLSSNIRKLIFDDESSPLFISTWFMGMHGEKLVLHDIYNNKELLEVTSAWPVEIDVTEKVVLLTTYNQMFEPTFYLIDIDQNILTSSSYNPEAGKSTSTYGIINACDINYSFDMSEETIRQCKFSLPGSDSNTSTIVFNDKIIWHDTARHVRFSDKLTFDDFGYPIEVFIFDTYTGGTGCPNEYTSVVISKDGYKVHGPFGNCMDSEGVQIVKSEANEGVDFLFGCGLDPVCGNHEQVFSYHCFVSLDITKPIQCKGSSFCSSYMEDKEEHPLYIYNGGVQQVEQVKSCNATAD